MLLTASLDRTLRLWSLATGRLERTFSGHTEGVQCCAFSPDGTLCLSASQDRTVRLWNLATGRQMFCFEGHTVMN